MNRVEYLAPSKLTMRCFEPGLLASSDKLLTVMGIEEFESSHELLLVTLDSNLRLRSQ